jgi:hypothetical protein
MVGRAACLLLLAGLAAPAQAASPWDLMFPVGNSCYARVYSGDHLAAHPQQRVTAMTLAAEPGIPPEPWPAVVLRLSLRGSGGGMAEAVAYCENIEATLYCRMEGDAGAFVIEEARDGAILVSVGRDGMVLETEREVVTLEQRRGDDRSFLLRPSSACP